MWRWKAGWKPGTAVCFLLFSTPSVLDATCLQWSGSSARDSQLNVSMHVIFKSRRLTHILEKQHWLTSGWVPVTSLLSAGGLWNAPVYHPMDMSEYSQASMDHAKATALFLDGSNLVLPTSCSWKSFKQWLVADNWETASESRGSAFRSEQMSKQSNRPFPHPLRCGRILEPDRDCCGHFHTYLNFCPPWTRVGAIVRWNAEKVYCFNIIQLIYFILILF